MLFFFPVGCLLLAIFVLFLPAIFLLLFLNIVTFSFEKLGISPQLALITLFIILIGSLINIPLTKRKKQSSGLVRFGWFQVPVQRESGLAINFGGAVIPVLLSAYLLTCLPECHYCQYWYQLF